MDVVKLMFLHAAYAPPAASRMLARHKESYNSKSKNPITIKFGFLPQSTTLTPKFDFGATGVLNILN